MVTRGGLALAGAQLMAGLDMAGTPRQAEQNGKHRLAQAAGMAPTDDDKDVAAEAAAAASSTAVPLSSPAGSSALGKRKEVKAPSFGDGTALKYGSDSDTNRSVPTEVGLPRQRREPFYEHWGRLSTFTLYCPQGNTKKGAYFKAVITHATSDREKWHIVFNDGLEAEHTEAELNWFKKEKDLTVARHVERTEGLPGGEALTDDGADEPVWHTKAGLKKLPPWFKTKFAHLQPVGPGSRDA